MKIQHDERLTELLASYALGILEGEDLRIVEEHLAGGCETCDTDHLALSKTVEAMVESIAPIEASDVVRARTLRAIEDKPLRPRSSGRSAVWSAAIAAGLILLVWSGWSQFDLRHEIARLTSDREDLHRELASVRSDLAATRGELARVLLAGRIVSAPRASSVLLAGLEAAPDSSARTYVDPATRRAVFYASNLRPLEADKTYQLWFIANGTPVSAGTFAVDSEGSGSVLVSSVAAAESLQAWAVTIEPAGGVPQPTGQMVLLGSSA